MVADEVHIDTLSYKEGQHRYTGSATAVQNTIWQEGDKETIGTEITLFLNEDNLEFAKRIPSSWRLLENIVLSCR